MASFTTELMRLEPEDFAESYLRAIGVEVVAAGEDFPFGSKRRGDLELLERLGFEIVPVPEVAGASSSAIRAATADGDVAVPATMLGRPYELDGVVVAGDQRGGTLGYPTANLAVDPQLVCPRFGIYAGGLSGTGRQSRSGRIRTTAGPSGASSRTCSTIRGPLRQAAGRRALGASAREAVFDTEAELIDQIGRDVDATRAASRHRSNWVRPPRLTRSSGLAPKVARVDARPSSARD